MSAPGFDVAEVERCACRVAERLEEAGLERVEVLRLPDAHPYVVAEWLGMMVAAAEEEAMRG